MNYYDNPSTSKTLSNAELMLLEIISQAKEISGYAIGKLVEERQYRVWADIGTTSIYTGLEKLKRKGLVTSRLDTAKRGKGPLRTARAGYFTSCSTRGRGMLHHRPWLRYQTLTRISPCKRAFRAKSERLLARRRNLGPVLAVSFR